MALNVHFVKAIAFANSKTASVSSVKLAKELDITQKTAWIMMDKLRNSNFEYLRKVL